MIINSASTEHESRFSRSLPRCTTALPLHAACHPFTALCPLFSLTIASVSHSCAYSACNFFFLRQHFFLFLFVFPTPALSLRSTKQKRKRKEDQNTRRNKPSIMYCIRFVCFCFISHISICVFKLFLISFFVLLLFLLLLRRFIFFVTSLENTVVVVVVVIVAIVSSLSALPVYMLL